MKIKDQKVRFERPFRTGDAVDVGTTVIAQFVHEKSMDRWCYAVEQCGGTVHSITDAISEPSTSNGRRRNLRRFTVTATVDRDRVPTQHA